MGRLKFLVNLRFFIYIFVIFISLNENLFANLNNKILIKVEDKVITNFDVKNKIISTLIVSGQKINQKNINKLKKQTVANLIRLRLKEIELLKHDLKIDQSQLDSYFSSVSKGNIENLKNSFKNNGGDFEIFKNEIETEFKWQRLILLLYSKKIEVDQNLVENELKNLLKKQENIDQYKLSEIEVFADNNNMEKNLLEIKSQIKEIGFEATAIKFSIAPSSSNGGEIGWISGKSMNKEIFKIVKTLKIGDVSQPVKKQESILIFKLLDKKSTKIKAENILKLKKQIIDRQKNDLFDLFSKSHLSKIKNLSMIEYK
tara:strand:- start:2156 stop:3100 length:945 start_codon:yes stop_codon:yes gene_type:complete